MENQVASTPAAAPAPALEKEAAITKVFSEVYVPRFLEKLASKGIKFKDKEEIDSALATVVMLKQASAATPAPVAKTAELSIIKQAALDLATALEASKPKALDNELVTALNSL